MGHCGIRPTVGVGGGSRGVPFMDASDLGAGANPWARCFSFFSGGAEKEAGVQIRSGPSSPRVSTAPRSPVHGRARPGWWAPSVGRCLGTTGGCWREDGEGAGSGSREDGEGARRCSRATWHMDGGARPHCAPSAGLSIPGGRRRGPEEGGAGISMTNPSLKKK